MSTEGGDAPRRELVVDAKPAPGDASDGGGTAIAPIVLPVIAAGLLAQLVSPAAGLAALGAALVLRVALRKPREGRFVLRVESGVLEVRRERQAGPPTRIDLVDLLDVTLDRRTHSTTSSTASSTLTTTTTTTLTTTSSQTPLARPSAARIPPYFRHSV